jgi:hypothetical protein
LGPMSLWKAIAVSVLAISGGAVLLVVTMPVWGGWLSQRSMQDTYDHISKVRLGCLPGTSQVIERWSKGGYSVSCRVNDVHDGPWQAWENGHVAITGAYARGKEHGTWFVYTGNGKQLYRTIVYENGAELSNVVH